MKTCILIAIALSLTACAGLDVTYQLQANYISKELAAKRELEAAKAAQVAAPAIVPEVAAPAK